MDQTNELLDLFLQLDEREGLQYAYISIRPNTRISDPDAPGWPATILQRVRQELDANDIVHGLRPDDELLAEIKSYLREYQQIQLSKTFYTFLAAQPTPPIRGDDGSLEVLIDLQLKPGKIKDPRSGRIDYHDLGFSETLVRIGDPLVVITHATPGLDGTDIFGQPIKAQPGKEPAIPLYDRHTITAETKEEPKQTILKARINGFFYHDSSRGYFIDKDVLTQHVDFHTGNIEVQDFTEIDTIIKVSGSRDILHDSVKPGFTLKAREIIVDGNVGRGAVLEGDRIVISGIVDAKALIRGQEIEIHKVVGARIEGRKIRINQVLQNASVNGSEIVLKTCVSSTITGEEVFIYNELRAGSITAARFIFCARATGNNVATLTIDPHAIPSFLEALEQQRRRTNELQREYREQEKQQKKRRMAFEHQHRPRLDNFFHIIEERKKTRLSPKQRLALEQLLRRGHYDSISKKLNLSFNKLIRQQLDEFGHGCRQLDEADQQLKHRHEELKKEMQLLREMDEAHTRGLILITGENSGEIKICFRATCLSPVIFNQKLLFCFDAVKNRIIGMKKFSSAGHRKMFTHLSPRALAAIDKQI